MLNVEPEMEAKSINVGDHVSVKTPQGDPSPELHMRGIVQQLSGVVDTPAALVAFHAPDGDCSWVELDRLVRF